MSSQSSAPAVPAMSLFERYLTLWVALCIVVGIALGHWFPAVFHAIGAAELAHVNLPVAALIWLMIIPMLVKVDFAAIGKVREHWRGIGVTLFINWAVKPFSMAALGWLFIGWLFAPWLPAAQIDSYIAGLILLAAAPCTAMVFVWSNLSDGEPDFTLTQVALNDTIMVVAFAPIVGLLLGLSAITVPWQTLLLSVGLYIVVPVVLAQLLRRSVLSRAGAAGLSGLLARLQPISLVALLTTLVLLFGFQGEQILSQPLIIALLAVPILIQVYFNAGLAYLLNRATGEAHCVAAPSALIGASNFFELAVAAAISLFGFSSGRGAGHRCRRADRGAGDAVGREDRQCEQTLVRGGTCSEAPGWIAHGPRITADERRSLSPETARRGGERDRCGTALPGGSNPVTTRIVRRVSRKQFAALDCGAHQHFRHKQASARQWRATRQKIPGCSAVAPAGRQSKRPYHWPGDAREVEVSPLRPKF